MVSYLAPVSPFVTTTLAPGITAFVASDTVPVTVPRSLCANDRGVRIKNKQIPKNSRRMDPPFKKQNSVATGQKMCLENTLSIGGDQGRTRPAAQILH